MRALAGGVALALLALAPDVAFAASGLPPGVHVDPSSPAGKQYVIPISAARGETSGAPHSSSIASNANPPLFGRGITPSRSRTGTSTPRGAGNKTTPSKTARHSSSRGNQTATSEPVAVNGVPPAGTSAAGAGGDGWVALVGGGALVLVVGTGAGLALRRRL